MILSILRNFNGDPNIVTMVTDNSAAEITTAGYFTGPVIAANVEEVNKGEFQTSETDLWLIYTTNGLGFYTYNDTTGGFVALTGNAGLSSTLSSGQMFVGSAGNVATGVPLSGDATLADTGAMTIANNAVTTAKINAAAVTLAKLATGIAPSHVVKFAGKDVSAGGSATVTITATGVAATDIVFAQIQASVNAVNVQKVTPTTNTITVLCSGDPGAVTMSYQALRAAV